MRKTNRGGNFFLALLFNLLLNLEWSVPAWILLLLHYTLGWSIRWFWIALGLWVIDILFWMKVYGWAAKCGNEPDPPKENKNPYSVKSDTDRKNV